MTVYEDIKARIAADRAAAEQWPCDETLEGARAEIVGDFLEVAERWQLKAQEWGPEEQFVAYRDMVCQQILDLLSEGLWPEEAS
ncbi:hypothetical protein IU436_30700 [Nocardia farcinica]|uniref:hypothetical protein n=1 Tax=Nocardia farcinica TaxID=37329 RepID=UPI0018946E3D|nr:hypothetical protein [Nocardia farcinica]MBF6422939.1 hypothetical protein [Nocardia farcinica]MBF6434679.1 hypothetical protein [Nocardia farcinica]MBF6505786.1 hypothetical protein [Nocardia farcinica]